jgi:hypothetical protein
VETKLHISSIALKVLMLWTPFVISKHIGTTSEAWLTMCISFANEGQTQVGWVVIVGWRMQKWTNVNNTPPKGSLCHLPHLNEMTVKSSCLEAFEKYSGNGCVKLTNKWENLIQGAGTRSNS